MNFCTEVLGTRISLPDKVAEEGYEVANLLRGTQPSLSFYTSSDVNTNTGFMCARFIRSPVTVKLDFSIPIDVSHVVICPKVGQQISTAFKLQTSVNHDARRGETLEQISREYVKGPPFPNTLVFRNPRFSLHRKYCDLPLAQFETHRNSPNSFQFRHPSYNSCERVFSLYITIERTHGISIPVLGSLEVWGQPSKWSKHAQREEVIKSWLGFLGANAERLKEAGGTEGEPMKKKPKTSSPQLGTGIIPEEFLDPITMEVILQPIRLPCGVAIDSETLEKYNREEAAWGRLPNDPFTGKVFTEDSGPLSDYSLKSRIEAFLVQHSDKDHVKILPRTLGTSSGEEFGSYQSSIISTTQSGASGPSLPSREHLTRQEILEIELHRVLGAGSPLAPTSLTNPRKCTTCEATQTSPPSSVLFYGIPCTHAIFCKTCASSFNKKEEFHCSSCNSKWTAKDLARLLLKH